MTEIITTNRISLIPNSSSSETSTKLEINNWVDRHNRIYIYIIKYAIKSPKITSKTTQQATACNVNTTR